MKRIIPAVVMALVAIGLIVTLALPLAVGPEGATSATQGTTNQIAVTWHEA
jgi:hypothetical protein